MGGGGGMGRGVSGRSDCSGQKRSAESGKTENASHTPVMHESGLDFCLFFLNCSSPYGAGCVRGRGTHCWTLHLKSMISEAYYVVKGENLYLVMFKK